MARDCSNAPPRRPDRIVARPDLVEDVVSAVQNRPPAVALVGIGGSGKSTLAAVACLDPRVRPQPSDNVTWLEAGKGKDPVMLLADLARLLSIGGTESGFATVGQGRDVLAAALHDRHVLIAVDNVWDRGPLDALIDFAPTCTVLFTTRRPELAAVFSATQIQVDEMTPGQAVKLLALWAALPAEAPMDEAAALCARLGNLALAVTMAGAMVARAERSIPCLRLSRRISIWWVPSSILSTRTGRCSLL